MTSPSRLEVVQLLSSEFHNSYRLDLPPLGEVASYRAGGGGTGKWRWADVQAAQEALPARHLATLPLRGRVLQVNSSERIKSCTTSKREGDVIAN